MAETRIQVFPANFLDDPQISVTVLDRWFHNGSLTIIIPGHDLRDDAFIGQCPTQRSSQSIAAAIAQVTPVIPNPRLLVDIMESGKSAADKCRPCRGRFLETGEISIRFNK